MTDNARAAAQSKTELRHGDHVDTIESVDIVFRAQRKLSFTYGAIFFGVTLLIPVLTNWVEAWWGNTIWGGFTLNYLFIGLIYYFFLWTMAWVYSKQADRLDDRLESMAAEITRVSANG